MTIDEAIAHAREVAKRRMAEYENHYDKDTHYYPTQCKKCAEEHIQLAEWLEELKQYRVIGTPEESRTVHCIQQRHSVPDAVCVVLESTWRSDRIGLICCMRATRKSGTI